MNVKTNKPTYVISGATSGIGLATAEVLSAAGNRVIGIGRDAERCRRAEIILRQITQNEHIHYITTDLSVQQGVREAARQVRQILKENHATWLDGLVNNAGTFTWWMTLTADGIETQWALNHLAPFLLTLELLPLLEKAPAGRVVTVSSDSHRAGRMNWNDLQLRRCYNGLLAYQNTKLANVLFTTGLRRRLSQESRVRAFAADPGLVNTYIGGKGTPSFIQWFWKLRSAGGVEPEVPARAIAWLMTESSLQSADQLYWKDHRPIKPSAYGINTVDAERLWEISSQQVGMRKE
jgi:retinol dehydrogenase 12